MFIGIGEVEAKKSTTNKKKSLNFSFKLKNNVVNKTVIHNKSGAVYTFLGFPCSSCDPFGK